MDNRNISSTTEGTLSTAPNIESMLDFVESFVRDYADKPELLSKLLEIRRILPGFTTQSILSKLSDQAYSQVIDELLFDTYYECRCRPDGYKLLARYLSKGSPHNLLKLCNLFFIDLRSVDDSVDKEAISLNLLLLMSERSTLLRKLNDSQKFALCLDLLNSGERIALSALTYLLELDHSFLQLLPDKDKQIIFWALANAPGRYAVDALWLFFSQVDVDAVATFVRRLVQLQNFTSLHYVIEAAHEVITLSFISLQKIGSLTSDEHAKVKRIYSCVLEPILQSLKPDLIVRIRRLKAINHAVTRLTPEIASTATRANAVQQVSYSAVFTSTEAKEYADIINRLLVAEKPLLIDGWQGYVEDMKTVFQSIEMANWLINQRRDGNSHIQ